MSKPTPAQRRFLLSLADGTLHTLTRQMEATCLIAGWIVRIPTVIDGITHHPVHLTDAGREVIGVPKTLPMLDAEVIIGGFRFKITKLSQPDLKQLIAALQTLVK